MVLLSGGGLTIGLHLIPSYVGDDIIVFPTNSDYFMDVLPLDLPTVGSKLSGSSSIK